MNITIRLTKVEYEMLKELQKRDKRYKKGLEEKFKERSISTCPRPINDNTMVKSSAPNSGAP